MKVKYMYIVYIITYVPTFLHCLRTKSFSRSPSCHAASEHWTSAVHPNNITGSVSPICKSNAHSDICRCSSWSVSELCLHCLFVLLCLLGLLHCSSFSATGGCIQAAFDFCACNRLSVLHFLPECVSWISCFLDCPCGQHLHWSLMGGCFHDFATVLHKECGLKDWHSGSVFQLWLRTAAGMLACMHW